MDALGTTLGERFPGLTLRGELASFTRAASGHCYFTLRDPEADASLRCVMFRRVASLVGAPPREGSAVELRGRLGVYGPRGELQCVVESLAAVGAGALYERFLRLRAALEAEGCFDPARRRPIPRWPRRIAVVSSLGAAALQDVLTALARRAPHLPVLVVPSLVQGIEAPAALVEALRRAAAQPGVELILLVRGGGSLEDLWAFNDPGLVRALAASPVPVLTGIGHETDLTLADLAADLRAPTPTAAAELAATDRATWLEGLEALARRGRQACQAQRDRRAERLDRLALRLARPGEALHRARTRLAALARRGAQAFAAARHRAAWPLPSCALRLVHAGRRRPAVEAARLDGLEARLAALDPQRVLARGWARVQDPEGRTLSSVRQLPPGQGFALVLGDGTVAATVDGPVPQAVAPARRRGRGAA